MKPALLRNGLWYNSAMRFTEAVRLTLRGYVARNKAGLLALLFITLFVIVGNAIYLSGWRDPNPTLQLSGLAVEAGPRILSGVDTIDPNNGFTAQALGNTAADKILSGDLPYWNHYEGVGSPLLGEMQSAALFPLTLLLAMPGGLLLSHVLLEVIAGFFTHLFLRRLGLSWGASLISGMIFSLNGTFAWLTNAVFNPIAFMPMMFYGLKRIIDAVNNGERAGWIWFALGLTLSLTAGFPETAFINALLIGAWGSIELALMRSKKLFLQAVKRIALSTAVGLALAMPTLIAFLGYLPYANIGGHADAFAHVALDPLSVPAQVLPYVYGSLSAASGYDASGRFAAFWGSTGGYFAITTCLLALAGLFSRMPRHLKFVLTAWIILCVLKMYGFGPAESLWNMVPTIKNAAFFRYVTPSISFALTILAAFGIEALMHRKISKKRTYLIFVSALAMILLLAFIARRYIGLISTAPHYKLFALASVGWAIGCVFAVAFTLKFIIRKYQAMFIFTIVATDILLMFIIPQLSTPTVKIDEAPVRYLKQHLGFGRYYTLGPVAPNYGSYYEIASINQNDLPVPKSWSKFITSNLDTHAEPILFTGYYQTNMQGVTPFSEFVRNLDNFKYTGVTHLVTMHDQLNDSQAAEASLTKVFSGRGADIYSLSNTQGYMVSSSNCHISLYTRDKAKAVCSGKGALVRKELFIPGWRASVNGRTVPIAVEREIFQKISLQNGISDITFSYMPPYMGYGYVIFAFGLIAIAWLGVSGSDYRRIASKALHRSRLYKTKLLHRTGSKK